MKSCKRSCSSSQMLQRLRIYHEAVRCFFLHAFQASARQHGHVKQDRFPLFDHETPECTWSKGCFSLSAALLYGTHTLCKTQFGVLFVVFPKSLTSILSLIILVLLIMSPKHVLLVNREITDKYEILLIPEESKFSALIKMLSSI